jgi:hypothetical protein
MATSTDKGTTMSKAYFTNTPEGTALMGVFCAALTKEGVVYEVKLHSDTVFVVNITGF